MPPRLPALGALRPLSKPSYSRAFSATASAAAPPREGSHTPSSTSSLLSLNRPKSHSNNNHRNHQSRTPQQQGGKGGSGGSSTRASDAAEQLLSRFGSRSAQLAKRTQATADSLREQKISNDYLREMPRRWAPGDVYSPHDLSPVEMTKWRRRAERKGDVIDALALRPLDMYKNFSMIAEFTKPSAQIMHSEKTGLRPVNQRKVAKMIRRAQGMGIYPTIHGHPEMIREMFFPFSLR